MPDLAQENTKISRRDALKKIGGIIAGAAVIDAVPAWAMGSLTEGRLDQRAVSMLKLKEIGDPKLAYIWAFCEASAWGAKTLGWHMAAQFMNRYLYDNGTPVDFSRELNLDIANHKKEKEFWDHVAHRCRFRLIINSGLAEGDQWDLSINKGSRVL